MIHTSRQLKALVRNMSGGDSTKAQIIIRNYVMERFLEYDIFIRDLHVLFKKYSINEIPENVVSFMIYSLTGRKAFPDTKDVINSLSTQYTIYIGSTSDPIRIKRTVKTYYAKKTNYIFLVSGVLTLKST